MIGQERDNQNKQIQDYSKKGFQEYAKNLGYAFDGKSNVIGHESDPRTVMKQRGAILPT